MFNGSQLVPANSKKQQLIFGFLGKTDAIILGVGVVISFLVLTIVKTNTIVGIIIGLLPVLTTAFLVFPIPNYQNCRILIIEIYNFYKNRRKYIWRGWCYTYEQSDEWASKSKSSTK